MSSPLVKELSLALLRAVPLRAREQLVGIPGLLRDPGAEDHLPVVAVPRLPARSLPGPGRCLAGLTAAAGRCGLRRTELLQLRRRFLQLLERVDQQLRVRPRQGVVDLLQTRQVTDQPRRLVPGAALESDHPFTVPLFERQ